MKQALLFLAGLMTLCGEEAIRPGARVYINQMDGFGDYVHSAFRVSSVPLVVTNQREAAEYELAGNEERAESRKFPHIGGGKGVVRLRLQKVQTGEVLYSTRLRTDKENGGKWGAAKAFARSFEVTVRSGRTQKTATVAAAVE